MVSDDELEWSIPPAARRQGQDFHSEIGQRDTVDLSNIPCSKCGGLGFTCHWNLETNMESIACNTCGVRLPKSALPTEPRM